MRPWNVGSTTTVDAKGHLAPDRRVGQAFERAGYVDVAWHMYQKTGDDKHLQPTGAFERVDQFWVSQPLAEAIVDYWLIQTPSDASDHAGIAFILDTELIKHGDTRQYG